MKFKTFLNKIIIIMQQTTIKANQKIKSNIRLSALVVVVVQGNPAVK